MNNNNNNSSTNNNASAGKRKNDNETTANKRARPRLDMSQGPKIPVRSTLASRSNVNSPINRFSNASTSSNTSTSSANKRLSNSSVTATAAAKRLSNGASSSTPRTATTKSLSNGLSFSSSAAANKRLSNSNSSSLSNGTASTATTKKSLTPPVKRVTDRKSSTIKKPRVTLNKSDPKKTIIELQATLESQGEEVSQIEELQESLMSGVQESESLLLEAKKKVANLESTMHSTQERYAQELSKIREKHYLKNKQLLDTNDNLKRQMDGRDQELKEAQQQRKIALAAYEKETRDHELLKVKANTTTASYKEVAATLNDLQLKLKSAGSELTEHENYIQELDNTIKSEKQRKLNLEANLIELETLRRKDHNRIQELKGNIRVFCRVRPCLEKKNDVSLASIRYFGEDNEKMELSEQISSTLGKTSTRSHQFSFDRVFSPESTQKDCFEEISQLVQSALDGYNVCIFAYGQTGSGKTFTMQGPPGIPNEETTGMIPKAVSQIYKVAQQLKQFGWEYTMEGQFLEIYNEAIHDLLGDVSSYGKIKHEIHHHENKGGGASTTSVTDMTTVVLDSPGRVKQMLRKASQNRATGSTNLNERSSRSHSVFTLKLTGKNKESGETTNGILNLIDLAGSERLSMSGSKGDRLKETQAINKSLSCLGDVIQALVNDDAHVPYRNSKLTYLLKNSLGGNCKTLMFVNVSPMLEHFGETICSLRFATKVNSCQIGTVKKSIK